MKLGRSFFSLYFLIISVFILFSWLLDQVWNSYIEQDIESYTGYKTMMSAIGDYLQKHPEDQWQSLLDDAAKRYELPLSLSSLAQITKTHALNSKDKKQLKSGKTTVLYQDENVWLHHQLKNSDVVIILGPAVMPTRPHTEALMRVIILAGFGVIIFIWLWPVSKDLDDLQAATKKFGEGEFDTKAPFARSNTIKPMVQSFNMMVKQIKRLIEAHKELTNAVAHELRTPLARSRFAVQMLATVKDETKQKKYLSQIENDIAELDQLINEMLLYASFDNEKPKLTIEPTDINCLIQNEIENFVQFKGTIELLPAHNLAIVADCDGYFMSRALSNYISNAVKYGNDQIVISCEVVDGYVLVHVEDNGHGVDDEFKERVFDAFSRADNSRNKEISGFGLGLAIVSRIMEWHHGQVLVENSQLGGAKFSLKWPVKLTS